jgi:hypothetical protein
MPKYRVTARTAYLVHSEPIEADSPEEALKKVQTYFDIDEKITPEYVAHQEFHEVYEDEHDESPPPTWMVKGDGTLERWH